MCITNTYWITHHIECLIVSNAPYRSILFSLSFRSSMLNLLGSDFINQYRIE